MNRREEGGPTLGNTIDQHREVTAPGGKVLFSKLEALAKDYIERGARSIEEGGVTYLQADSRELYLEMSAREAMIPDEWECNGECHEIKPHTEFSLAKACSYLRRKICKVCDRKKSRERAEKETAPISSNTIVKGLREKIEYLEKKINALKQALKIMEDNDGD